MNKHTVESFPPFFGVRRELSMPPLERIDFPARDGSALCLHHTSGGERGPVIMTPGTAMTALTYCIDSVPKNLVEFLVGEGFDVWLFDWRTSPLLDAHLRPYTLDDVAKNDWPAAVDQVLQRTGKKEVSVLAHCLSSPCFLLSLVRGYLPTEKVRSYVASQVALHLRLTRAGTVKVSTRLDRLLPDDELIHQKPAEVVGQFSDTAASILARVMPRSFSCGNRACYRQVATFGEIILHSRVNQPTHAMMGELVPECGSGFLKDVAVGVRRNSILNAEDLEHLDRLRLPILFISGQENRMFIPESTAQSYQLLRDTNGPSLYRRTVYPGFGHLDCYIGAGAAEQIWPDLSQALDSPPAAVDKRAAS